MDGLMSQRATKKTLRSYYHQNVVRFAGKNFFRALTRRSTFGKKLAKLKIIR